MCLCLYLIWVALSKGHKATSFCCYCYKVQTLLFFPSYCVMNHDEGFGVYQQQLQWPPKTQRYCQNQIQSKPTWVQSISKQRLIRLQVFQWQWYGASGSYRRRWTSRSRSLYTSHQTGYASLTHYVLFHVLSLGDLFGCPESVGSENEIWVLAFIQCSVSFKFHFLFSVKIKDCVFFGGVVKKCE